MVLDLRLVKIGCRDDNQFFFAPTPSAAVNLKRYNGTVRAAMASNTISEKSGTNGHRLYD